MRFETGDIITNEIYRILIVADKLSLADVDVGGDRPLLKYIGYKYRWLDPTPNRIPSSTIFEQYNEFSEHWKLYESSVVERILANYEV